MLTQPLPAPRADPAFRRAVLGDQASTDRWALTPQCSQQPNGSSVPAAWGLSTAPAELVGLKAVLVSVTSEVTRVCPRSWHKVHPETLDKQCKKQLVPLHCAGHVQLHLRVKGEEDWGSLALPFPVVCPCLAGDGRSRTPWEMSFLQHHQQPPLQSLHVGANPPSRLTGQRDVQTHQLNTPSGLIKYLVYRYTRIYMCI